MVVQLSTAGGDIASGVQRLLRGGFDWAEVL